MAIGVPSNFSYGGKLPNFDRDQFTTLQAMLEFPVEFIDEGHISYCLEDSKHYKFNGSEWEEFKTGTSISEDFINSIGNRVLKFNDISALGFTIESGVILNTTVDNISYCANNNCFYAEKSKPILPLELLIEGSGHGSYNIDVNTDLTSNPNINWDDYKIIYSNLYGFCRSNDMRTIYTKVYIPTEYTLEDGKIYSVGNLTYVIKNRVFTTSNNRDDYATYTKYFIIDELIDNKSYEYAVGKNSTFVDSNNKLYCYNANGELVEKTEAVEEYIADFVNGGVVNIQETGTIEAVYNKLSKGGVALCIIGDSKGSYPSTESRVNVNSKYLKSTSYLFSTDNRGANVGDLLMITKRDYILTTVCALKIIPINDCKLQDGSYYATEGIITAWDKQRINKVDGVEWTANHVRDTYLPKSNAFPSNGGWLHDVQQALSTGVYATCSVSSAGITEFTNNYFTCIVQATTTVDAGGYNTIEQTAYGREADEGKIYKRVIFTNGNDYQYKNWVKIGG